MMTLKNQTNIKSFISPRKFYIGYDIILEDFHSFVLDENCNNILFICSSIILKYLNENQFFQRLKLKFKIETLKCKFSTMKEIQRLSEICKSNKCDSVVAIGGGNVIDCAKAVSFYEKCSLIIIPSIPSNDSPSTSFSVIYNEKGEFENYLFFKKNADLIIADTHILIQSPLKYISAGIGDAIATYYEVKSCIESKNLNLLQTKPTISSLYISESCFNIIQDNIENAFKSILKGIVNDEFSNLMESVVLLSGIGAESGGLSCAHSISNGLSSLGLNSLHGENVAFGLIIQSILENWEQNEIDKLIKIYLISNLPLTLQDLGLNENDFESIKKVAIKSNLESESMSHMKYKFNNDEIYNAILKANSFGKRIKYNKINK